MPIAKQVSIPYGSIKSRTSSSTAIPSPRVSIPYGSIKSFGGQRVIPKLQKFRFLMVRLKARPWPSVPTPPTVSIPYGSIKRLPRYYIRKLIDLFQFLMVRLKDATASPPSSPPSPFQFLMVRLKGGFFLLIFKSVRDVSIPYGSIKSFQNNKNMEATYKVSIPYGSIKSRCRSRFARCSIVSIPYGSIKSGRAVRAVSALRSFNSVWFD